MVDPETGAKGGDAPKMDQQHRWMVVLVAVFLSPRAQSVPHVWTGPKLPIPVCLPQDVVALGLVPIPLHKPLFDRKGVWMAAPTQAMVGRQRPVTN